MGWTCLMSSSEILICGRKFVSFSRKSSRFCRFDLFHCSVKIAFTCLIPVSAKRGALITMIWTTIGLSLIYALFLRYWKNLSYPKFYPTSTLTIFTILVNQYIVLVTALKQLFWKLLMICSFFLTKETYLCLPCLTFIQYLTQLIILLLYTVSILTLDLLMLSIDSLHLIWLIVHTILSI